MAYNLPPLFNISYNFLLCWKSRWRPSLFYYLVTWKNFLMIMPMHLITAWNVISNFEKYFISSLLVKGMTHILHINILIHKCMFSFAKSLQTLNCDLHFSPFYWQSQICNCSASKTYLQSNIYFCILSKLIVDKTKFVALFSV